MENPDFRLQIATAGEALIDLIQQPDGAFAPCLGGAVFNLTRALARQSAGTLYLNPLSGDRFGQQLTASLVEDGVHLARPEPVAEVTSLAVVALNTQGVPDYAFYREAVADRATSAELLGTACNAQPELDIVATGCLALSPADGDVYLPWLKAQGQAGKLVAVDANLRLSVMPDLTAYRQHILTTLQLADLIKASDEDLNSLQVPGASAIEQAQYLLANSPAKALVLTLGGEGAMLLMRDGRQWRAKDTAPVVLQDTVGAGDCFFAGFLVGLLKFAKLGKVTAVKALADLGGNDAAECLARGVASASWCVMQRGCVPPTADEVTARLPGVAVHQAS